MARVVKQFAELGIHDVFYATETSTTAWVKRSENSADSAGILGSVIGFITNTTVYVEESKPSIECS